MYKRLHTFIVIIIIFGLSACAQGGAQTARVNILPENCQLKTGEEIALTLDGQIPSNTKINWKADAGEIVWAGQGLTANFTAPKTAGPALVSVSFVSSTPSPLTASRTCTVIDETPPSPPDIPNTPSTPAANYTIVISEVMGNPCGGLESRKFNQYVELYNYGDQPVDVGGWWLFDEGEKGTPDQLGAWDARSTTRLDSSLVTNSTLIPAHGFAVVISPMYPDSYVDNQRMPYHFPAGTVILTPAASSTLGDDFFGIIAASEGRDTLTLYIGGASVMNSIVDTYGTPAIPDFYPIHIDDDHIDYLPLYLHECESAERVDPRQPDAQSNWIAIKGGSPGEGPY